MVVASAMAGARRECDPRYAAGPSSSRLRAVGPSVAWLSKQYHGCVAVPPTPPTLKSVGEFIRTQRELMSLSMRQLAGMAAVSNPYLSQIERGVYTPSAQVLKAIAAALDLSTETLYQQAGLLDDTVERPAQTVEDAIRMDRRLTPEGKQALLQVYRGLVASNEPAPEREVPARPRRLTKPPTTRSRSAKR